MTVAWAASTDNIAVENYLVYRGTTADFAVEAASQIGQSSSSSFVDSGLANGTYYYKVVARDAAGNTSAPVGPGLGDGRDPGCDPDSAAECGFFYVVSTQPTTNNGLNNQLTSRLSSPTLETFLKFDLPAAPAGTTLTGVSLQVRTSNDVTAATNDATDFEVVSNGWAEDTITWSNRPTGAGVPFGTLAWPRR